MSPTVLGPVTAANPDIDRPITEDDSDAQAARQLLQEAYGSLRTGQAAANLERQYEAAQEAHL
jgi:hypothetical protein